MITMAAHRRSQTRLFYYDQWMIAAVLSLIAIGLTMLTSSSLMVATKYHHQPFYFLLKQLLYLVIGFSCALGILKIESTFWEQWRFALLLAVICALLLVLVPGVGHAVNGSRRWLALGPLSIQVSELAKLAMVFYTAGYITRHQNHLNDHILGFIKPLLILAIVACLLLKEPDFGATIVISCTVMAMIFLTGVKLRYYLAMVTVALVAFVALAISSPYRLARITAFLNPWADQFNSGYQLTQSLIAFGRGGVFGVGLGNGVQKLFYLPESHTDFLFAVLAEEIGLFGVLLVLGLYSIIMIRGLLIALRAYRFGRIFPAFVAYGLTCWLALQTIINMGVNAGLLPTKGLTLPFLSYGGASIVINCIVIGLLLRIDYENKILRAT